MFAVPKVEDVAVQIKAWEDQNQKDFRMLAGLIRKIHDIARESGGKAILKYNASRDNWDFHKLGVKQILPKDLYAKWESRGSDEQGIHLDVKIVGQSIKGAESVVSEKALRTAGMEGNIAAGA